MRVQLITMVGKQEEHLQEVDWDAIPSVGQNIYLTDYFKEDTLSPFQRAKYKVKFVDWVVEVDHLPENAKVYSCVQIHLKRVK